MRARTRTLSTVCARVLIASLLLVNMLSGPLTADAQYDELRILDTVHMLPGDVRGEGWDNLRAIQIQDVSEDGLLQHFSHDNSAYPKEREPLDESQSSPQSDTPLSESDTVTEEASEPGDAGDVEIVVPPPEEPQEPDVQESSVVSFFKRAYELLPFAQESIIEPVTETQRATEGSETTESTPSSEEEVSSEPQVNEEVPVSGAEEGTPPSLPGDIVEDESVEEPSVPTETPTEEIPLGKGRTEPIIFSDFGIPPLEPGQLITNVQLRLSLGALIEDAHDPAFLAVSFREKGREWMDAGSIPLVGEVSNALNRGYFLFALPFFTKPEALEGLEVRVSLDHDVHEDDTLFIDALWLEIDTETFDRTLLEKRLLPEEFSDRLRMPDMHEVLSDTLDFAREENPEFVLKYQAQRSAVVNFFRSVFGGTLATIDSVVFIKNDGGVADVSPTINMTDDGLWTIQIPPEDRDQLQPGTYTMELTVAEGDKRFTDTMEFQWGMLAQNPNQTEYALGDTSHISFGALSPSGNTICDANLELYVFGPDGSVERPLVTPSHECLGNTVVSLPDYTASFTPTTPGTYELYVEHVGSDGSVLSHTQDTIEVVDTHGLWISREGPTRIYPPSGYPMRITVHSVDGFTGTLIEYVPQSFIIYDTDAVISEASPFQELSWEISVPPGGTQTFSYSFDAPDISPYLYTLGPAELVSVGDVVTVTEVLPVEPVPLILESITTQTTEGDALLQASLPLTHVDEGDVVHDNTPLSVEEASVPEPNGAEETGSSLDISAPDTPKEDPSQTDDESPGFFESLIGGILGTEEDAPPVSSPPLEQTTSQDEPGFLETIIDTLFGEEEVLPVVVPETDTLTATTTALGTTPTTTVSGARAFGEHRKWQIASDATGSMLLYWASTTIPTGWTCVSCLPSDSFYQRFVLGSSTPGINGGASSHTHSATGVVTDSASSTSINQQGGGGTANVPTVGHDHTYAPVISTDSNLPSYRELVLIQFNSAGSPQSLPANTIAIFDDTVPSGWDRYAVQDNSYIRANGTTTIGTTGGSNTHSHTISGNLVATTNFLTAAAGDNLVNSASANHTHAVNSFTDTVSHEPPYREAILGKLAATSSPADAMIAMWTDTPPAGWSTVSSTSEPFLNRFVKPSATYGGTGGTPTTTHGDTTGIISGTPSGTQTRDLVTIDNTVTTNAHTHAVSVTNYSAVTTLPPYRTAIFAKRGVGGALPEAPVVHVLFDNEKTGTSTPRLEFTGEDIDGADTLVYQVEWDDDEDIDTSPLGSRTSDNETGCSPNCFTNTASTTDTNPFTDNERIRFSIQSALTSGTTYYWRVRVKETAGDTWSEWSTIQSFTYESGVSLSEWHQTEGFQFDGGTLANAATSSGAVSISSLATQVPVIASYTSSTIAASASLTLTKPSNVEAGDLLLILVGNDDNTATAQWDDVSLRPTGFTLINESGSNVPDAHVAAFYKIADGTESATTSVPAQSADNFWGFYLRVTGASTTNPINVVGSDYAVNTLQNHPIPSVTTTLANTLAFYMLGADTLATAPFSVSGTGWSEQAEATIVATAGTWGTRSMISSGATGVATVTMAVTEGAAAFQFAVNPNNAFATVLSPEVDFDVVTGQSTWGEIEWHTTEPTGSDTRFHVYYTSTTTCDTLVPDSALSGNSAGFSSAQSPITLTNLSTTTYNRICLKSRLLLDASGSSPTLDDWTVRWQRTPQYTQMDYHWYANLADITPGDAWPSGVIDIDENDPIDTSQAVMRSSVLRLRMSVMATSSVVSVGSALFKLQYAEGTTCGVDLDWYDVGALGSTTALWRGYDNSTTTDGTTLPSALLTNTTILGTYEEANNSATNPNSIPIGGIAEWDWVLQNNAGAHGGTYCFRMVKSDGTSFTDYTNYPTLITNSSPDTLLLYAPFDNEKVASTSPYFEFNGVDPESNDISYQIQIDDDYLFGSVNADRTTISNPTEFENLVTPADKDPYTNGERIRFSLPAALALSNGTTYYWRVRGLDPSGSNDWGEWSEIYSLTVDTSVTVSTWFQTTEEQFDTNTHAGTDATASDLVTLGAGSTTGTTTSSEITFTNGATGNAWGSLAWTDTETSSDIKYRLQYYDSSTGEWDFIPTSDLAGNDTGFDTSPLSLLDLNTDTYGVIRILAILTNSGANPSLSDWTLSWGYRIETPTLSAPFRNEKVSTTTPTFEFVTTDPQGDDLVYEIQWSASSTFAASTTRTSSTSAGFVNADNGGDTSPFTSGDTIQFTIQTADALVNGRTYWWRVRATDPQGSSQYSFYSDEQSFTVDTSVTVSTWFQTTAEQFNTDTLSGAVTTGSSSVTVASTSVETLLVYAEGTIQTPRYRIWDGSVWGSEQSALSVSSAITWVVAKASPGENEYVMATMGTDADVNVQVYANGTWDHLQELTTIIPNTNMRGFDVAYEQLSGDAMVVTCDGDATPSYWIWNGTSWTNNGGIGNILGNTCGWVKLISDPISDEIIAVLRDTTGTRYEARVWDGSAWGNSVTLGSMSQPTHEGIAAEYEDSGNQAVVAVSNAGNASFQWRAWNGTTATWTATATVGLGDDFEAGTMRADDGTDNMVFCYVDEDGDTGVQRWTGAGFAATGVVEFSNAWATAGNIYNDRPVDCMFETNGTRNGYITALYSTTTAMASSTFVAAWTTSQRISPAMSASGVRVQLARTGSGLIQALSYASTTDRYEYTDWNGSSWSAVQILETDGSAGATPFREPFMMAPKNPVTSGTVVGDPLGIDFYGGSGPYWQQMSWNDTTSGGSDILYQVEYYDGDSWELIPDSLIPGNSAGTSTSPINLTSVLPVSTYNLIRPVANMTCNLGTCPILNDWTITWSPGITISGTADAYDETTDLTSGTLAVALDGTLQIGKTGTISGGTWSIANVNASPGDIVTVFVNGANEANEAVAIARYDGVGDMSGMRLYERHVTLGSNDATSTAFTNAEIGYYDYQNDEDLFFNATTTALDLCVDTSCGDSELYVMASTTYRPTGLTDLNYFENNGTTTLDGNTIYIGRSWDNNATVTAGTSTVVFTATGTTEYIDETGAHAPSFYNLTFGTTTGSATWMASTSLDVNNALTITRGTLSRGTTTLTIGGSLTIQTNGVLTGISTTTFDGTGTGNVTDNTVALQNLGYVVIDGTSKTVQLGNNARVQSLTIGADDIFDVTTGNHGLTVHTHFVNNNTFLARSGTTTFAGTTTALSITAGGDAFYNLAFTGVGGAWSFTEPTLSIGNNLTIATGTVTFPTATTTITGSFDSASGTFAHNNSVVVFNGSGSKSVRQAGGTFTNAFYNVVFSGSGTYTYLDTTATTTNDFTISAGSVVLPSGTLTVQGNFLNTAGSFSPNTGTVKVSGSGTHSIDANASFYHLLFAGTGTTTFVDTSVTAQEDVTILSGVVTFPTNTFTIGGSVSNAGTILHASGTVLMNSSDTGETVSFGTSTLAHLIFNSSTGGWTMTTSATTTGSTTLTSVGQFTLNPGLTLTVGGVFTNSAVGASTTWSGSTLALIGGNSYTINAKTNTLESYGTLQIGQNTDVRMWNATATTYTVDTSGSLYSQDHNAQDGSLYIFGEYVRTSGSEHWSYATDFDGTALGTSTARAVDVRFASSSSARIASSLFSVVGTGTASTTVRNQGVGSYTLRVEGGTTTMQYYDVTDFGLSGITLASGTKVTTLSDGRFIPTVASSTALTVSSTTIDANTALQLFRVNFSTTSLIFARNVTQNDGSPSSYWWFRSSTGTIDGEDFDNDTGDPGSVRWDDSSLTIVVSGTVYGAGGTTTLGAPTCGAGSSLRLVVEGGSTYNTSCDGSGLFTFPAVTIVGDPTLTVFLNDAPGGERAVTLTKTPTTDITDLDLIVGRVITRHEDTSAFTIEDMATYDSADDSDVPFAAATGTNPTLTVEANIGLQVFATTTFTPGGVVTLLSGGTGVEHDGTLFLSPASVFTGAGTTTYTVGGSLMQGLGATFVPASSTVVMTATTTGKGITSVGSESIALNALSFTGVNGGWNLQGNLLLSGGLSLATGTLTGTGNITLTNGSFTGNGLLSLGTGTTTLVSTNILGGTQPWTFHHLVLGTGSGTGTTSKATTATTTVAGTLRIGTGHFFEPFGSIVNLTGTGTVFVESGTFVESTSTVRYGGTEGSNVLSTTYYNLLINGAGGTPTYTGTGLGIVVSNALTVGGTANTTFTLDTNDPALDVNGSVTIESGSTLVGSNSGVFTVAGSWNNDGTYTASSGLVTFDGSGAHTIAQGASSFANMTASGTGSYTVTEHGTTTGTLRLQTLGGFTVNSGVSLAVGTTFVNALSGGVTTWTGSTLFLYGGGNYSVNGPTTTESYDRLTIGGSTQIRMWNADAVTYDLSSNASLYSQDHSGVNGDLSIFGAYVKTTGTDYWSYATDFDGTALSGGNERQVDVRVSSGGSVLYTGGGLSVIGGASASTTIQNQGSGTYSMRIGGSASTTMRYYTMSNFDTNGLTFSGTPNVVNLSNGAFTVGVASGTAMTVGGTVINQNPARTFSENSFSTSTGGLAFNVTATGTTASSWRFTNHGGALSGESYDVDPDGDPGYIVWDNSAASLSFSGRVYSDEGTTVSPVCDGSTNITLRVAGLTSYTTSCNGLGLYSFTGITYSPGDSFVIYIDGEAEKAAVVSEDPVTSIANLDLYENRVIVRHEGADPLSIADMAVWDSTDDADIPFTAVDAGTDTLTLPANTKLLVWTGKEFEPNGNVTLAGGGGGAAYDGTLELKDNATFDATGSETHSIGGSFIMGSGALFDDETSTFTFTTSGAARTIDTNELSFYHLTLNGSGSWTIANTNLEVGGDLTLTQGTLTLPVSTSTFLGSFLNTGGSFVQNGGSVFFAGSGAKSIRMGGGAFGTTTFGGTGTWSYLGTHGTTTGNFLIASGTVNGATGTLTVGGSFVNQGTFVHQNGTLRMTSALSSTTINASTSDLGGVTIAGTGTFVFTDPTEALAGSLTLLSGTTTLPTSTISIGGSLVSNGGAFVHATGTVLMNSSDTGEFITPGTSTFTNLTIAAPSGGYTISSSATTTEDFTLQSATAFTLGSGAVLTVEGVFTNSVGGAPTTWTGSTLRILTGSEYTANTKSAGGDTYNVIALGNNTDLRLWNSVATTSLLDTTSSLYSQNNGAVSGELYIYGDYRRSTGADYWSATTDFDGTAISSRAVTVRHAQGATSTFSGGTLEIIGTPTATTTITNQGSGTYSLQVLGGTLNALYYALRNADAYGLVLGGTTTVTSLANGDYELAVSGGALMTVSSTTLNYNASAVISGVRFATTTAITGVNVALVGTTPSAWTFTSHRGNLDGEAFDSDGGDACGSVRWDDSTCLLTQESGYRWRGDDGGEGVPDSEWYDLDWTKRKRVTITNADASDYTNAVVEVPITYDGDMQTDFDDIHFTDSSGTTSLSFVREVYTASTDATFWVKIPTLLASQDTSIYMYYGNGGATYGGVGTTTFVVYDDYEDGNITEYSGDASLFAADTTFAYQGTYGLEAANTNGRTTDGIYRTSASSTVSQGQTIRYMEYVDTVGGSLDEACTLFGVQGNQNNNYGVCLEQVSGTDRISISRGVDDNDQSGTIIGSTTVSYTTGWYEVEIDWGTNNVIFVSLYKDDVLVATTSATDSNYTTGGFGYTFWFQSGGWDFFTARATLTSEPTTTIGYEQVSGGASWLAEPNTLLPGVSAGTTIRPRFIIENTGLTVSDQYRLMYAEKGASPSCEAVSSLSYTAVPVQASCGTSPVCMVTSSHFVSGAPTTDVLGGDGTFTPGEIIEDPSNTAGSVTLDADEYTEVEYAISITGNATEPAYCFRVSDAGTAIDSYIRVAELGLVFEPNISSVTFNDGADITLTPGGTTTVYATGTVSDQNGYADIVYATTTMYRSGMGQSCTDDTNNCYIAGPSRCTYTSCSGDSCEIVCRSDFYYHADPTDTGSTYDAESWGALLSIEDQSGYIATQTAPFIELLTLRALSADSLINYGSLEVNQNTGSYNATTTFNNIGNDAIDVLIEGTDLSDGLSSTIPVTEQIFATSSFSYSSCTYCSQLTASSTVYELDLAKPATTTPGVSDEVFWGIEIPFGVSANAHTGSNIFYATGD